MLCYLAIIKPALCNSIMLLSPNQREWIYNRQSGWLRGLFLPPCPPSKNCICFALWPWAHLTIKSILILITLWEMAVFREQQKKIFSLTFLLLFDTCLRWFSADVAHQPQKFGLLRNLRYRVVLLVSVAFSSDLSHQQNCHSSLDCVYLLQHLV